MSDPPSFESPLCVFAATPGNSTRFEYLDTSSSRRKRQKKKKVLFTNPVRPSLLSLTFFVQEKKQVERISSDVPSTVYLQHVDSQTRQGRMAGITFMPKKLFRSNSNSN